MEKATRKIVLALALVVVAVAALVAVRTLLFRSRQITSAVEAANLPLPAPAIERFAAAIRFKTISGDPAADEEFPRFREFLQRSFPRVHATLAKEIIGGHSLLYSWPGRDANLKPILLMGHLDVVPVESDNDTKWHHPPFGGRIADGYIWGRGTIDAKLNVLGLLEAVELLLAQGFRPQRTTYLAFGHDEETGGQQGAAQIAALLGARNVALEFVLDEGSAITEGIVPGVAAPVAAVGVAEKGYLSLQLTVDGPGGHSSMPPASTAIGILSRAIDKLERTPFPARIGGAVEEFFAFVGPEMHWFQRILLANRWLFEPWLKRELAKSPLTATLIRTTQAATMFHAGMRENMLPAQARAVVNFRLLNGDTIDQVQGRTREIIADARVKVAPLVPAMEASPISKSASDSFKLLHRTIRQIYPKVIVAPFLSIATTDARHYNKLSNNIYRFAPFTVRPQDADRFHGVDERVSVQDYERCVRFYSQLILNSQQ
jgi:carboxypeptidase PM20D1